MALYSYSSWVLLTKHGEGVKEILENSTVYHEGQVKKGHISYEQEVKVVTVCLLEYFCKIDLSKCKSWLAPTGNGVHSNDDVCTPGNHTL